MDLVVQTYKGKNKSDDNVDWISELSDDVLLLILSRLTTKEAIRTSVVSKRWEHLWKKLSHLVFNTRNIIDPSMLRRSDDSNPDAELTKVINNHSGDLESCAITHISREGVHGLLNTWIHSLVWMVKTRNLTLANRNNPSTCSFPPCFLSHPSLMSLSLKSYYLTSSRPFNNCSNIKTLKLLYIFAPEVEVFNKILTSCPSLEVLVLQVTCIRNYSRRYTLKIENTRLKFLEIYSICGIDKVTLSAPSLDILVTRHIFCGQSEFLIQSPNLQFNGNSRVGKTYCLHIIYNISKEKNSGHEELVNRIGGELRGDKYPTLSVAVDLMNQTEVERLRQVLCLWSDTMMDLEIKFKGDNAPGPSEEIECWQKKLWVENNDHDDSFPNAKFRVELLSIYNFRGSKQEIAFVSCLIRQGNVLRKIMINSNLFSASNRSNIEAAVAKLKKVQSEDQQKVTIEYCRD